MNANALTHCFMIGSRACMPKQISRRFKSRYVLRAIRFGLARWDRAFTTGFLKMVPNFFTPTLILDMRNWRTQFGPRNMLVADTLQCCRASKFIVSPTGTPPRFRRFGLNSRDVLA